MARFSHHPSIFAWELFNEVNLCHSLPTDAILKAWHARMSRFLKRHDVYNHLVTQSFAGNPDLPGKARLRDTMQAVYGPRGGMDFSQTHQYQVGGGANVSQWADPYRDAASEVGARCASVLGSSSAISGVGVGSYGGPKPHYFGEFGLQKSLAEVIDKRGLSLHNANFAALASGCAGTPGPWWWTQYVDRFDLYHHFRAVAAVARGIDWGLNGHWRAVSRMPSESSRGLRVYAIAGQELGGPSALSRAAVVVAWIQHENSTWSWTNGSCYMNKSASSPDPVCVPSALYPRSPAPIPSPHVSINLTMSFAGLQMNAKWVNTWTGKEIAQHKVSVGADGTLRRLSLPFDFLTNDSIVVLTQTYTYPST